MSIKRTAFRWLAVVEKNYKPRKEGRRIQRKKMRGGNKKSTLSEQERAL